MVRVRILHVCETAKGGVGTYINLFAEFGPAGPESIVVAPAQHAGHLDARHETVTFAYPARGIGALCRMLRATFATMREVQPDVIFCHSTFSLVALLSLRLCLVRRPIIFCPHGWAVCRYEDSPLRRRIVGMIEGSLPGLATAVVNVSSAEHDLAKRLGYFGTHFLLENAVPDARSATRSDLFSQEPPCSGKAKAAATGGVLNLLFVGRLDRQKGLDVLLEAFTLVATARPDIKLHVVGESVNKDSLLDRLPRNIALHGWVDKERIDDWYRSADALIVPSRWEGLPLVVPEALRNGTPALVSDRGALPTLVDPGRTGAIFALEPESIADLLLNLDRDTLRAMRRVCRESYEAHFAFDRFQRRFLSILADICPQGAREDRANV